MCKASCSKIIESLYFKRGLGITGDVPPGLPEPRTAAAHAAGTAGTAGTAGRAQASPALLPSHGWEGMLQPFYVLLSPRPVAVNSWDAASGWAVRGEVPVVAGGSCLTWAGSLCVVPLTARCSRNAWAGLACKYLGSLYPVSIPSEN